MSAEDFSVNVMDVQNLTAVEEHYEYVKQLLAISTLHLQQAAKVCKANKERKECSLFYFIFEQTNLGTMVWSWTNVHVSAAGLATVTESKTLAYVGL